MGGTVYSRSVTALECADPITLPLALEVKFGSRRIGVTHNDVIGLDWQVMRKKASAKQVDHCVWSRNRFNTALSHPLANPIANIDLVVSGHNPHPTPVWAGNQVYIDTLWKGGLHINEC